MPDEQVLLAQRYALPEYDHGTTVALCAVVCITSSYTIERDSVTFSASPPELVSRTAKDTRLAKMWPLNTVLGLILSVGMLIKFSIAFLRELMCFLRSILNQK